MKSISVAVASSMVLSSFGVAGGDIEPVVSPVQETVLPAPQVSGFYLGAGVSALSWTEESDYAPPAIMMPIGYEFKETWTGGTLIAGYQFNHFLSVEGRYAMNLGDASREIDGMDAGDSDAELDNLALYLKPAYAADRFSIYALLGYGKTTFEHSMGGEFSESGFQWGVGAGYNLTEQLTAFVDYAILYDDKGFDDLFSEADYKVDAVTVGVTYKF